MQVAFVTAGPLGGMGLNYIAEQTAKALLARGWLSKAYVGGGHSADIPSYRVVEVPTLFTEGSLVARGLLWMADRLRARHPISDRFFDFHCKRLLEECDVFHGMPIQCYASMMRAKAMGARVVADNPNAHPELQRELLEEERGRWRMPGGRLSGWSQGRWLDGLDAADGILLLSSFAYDSFLARGVPAKKLAIAAYGVDLDLFRPRPKPDEVFRVLFLGQVCVRKGVPYLLQAWAKLRLKDAELVLVGPIEPGFEAVLASFGDLPGVRVVGPAKSMAEVATHYNQASLFCFPSIEDGFAMVVTEAMASGLPVIVSQNTGARDVVEDGKAGFIVPIRDTEPLAEKLQELHADVGLRRAMGLTARAAAENHPWSRYEEDLASAYRGFFPELLGGASAEPGGPVRERPTGGCVS